MTSNNEVLVRGGKPTGALQGLAAARPRGPDGVRPLRGTDRGQ